MSVPARSRSSTSTAASASATRCRTVRPSRSVDGERGEAGSGRRELGSAHPPGRHRGCRQDASSRTSSTASRSPSRSTSSPASTSHRRCSIRNSAAAPARTCGRSPSSSMTMTATTICFANTDIPAVYALPAGAVISMTDGAKVASVGDVIARIPAGIVEDPRHYGWSAACCRPVRSAQAEGSGDHGRSTPVRSASARKPRASGASSSPDESGESTEDLIPKWRT